MTVITTKIIGYDSVEVEYNESEIQQLLIEHAKRIIGDKITQGGYWVAEVYEKGEDDNFAVFATVTWKSKERESKDG